ncbi:hypothetical protein EVB79_045 [Rhizobium phage RHph_N3_13]|nr:hypothetical protein EVB79_045 [Rhizobium phage RHph_N3_13]QIG69871.1 hypothetical protein F67_I3_11_045 [Rhizobium phage RHph_I3_11]
MFRVGDRVYHKNIPTIFGIISEIGVYHTIYPNTTCCKTKWYPKPLIDKNLEGVYGYEVVEPFQNYTLIEPNPVEYKYDQSGDTDEDI